MVKYVDVYNNYGSDQPAERRELYHYNCAEVLLRTGNAEYDLGLDDKALSMMQGFGGGFYSGHTCGAFCGALAVLSVKYAKERPTDMAEVKKATKLLVEEFEKEFGSLDCSHVKAHHAEPENGGCNPVKCRAAEVLTRVVEKMEKE